MIGIKCDEVSMSIKLLTILYFMVAMKLMVSVIFPSWPMQLINHGNVKNHMKDHREHLIAIMMYKIVNNLINIEASSHLIPITSGTCCHPIRY